ncbi:MULTISPECIES: TIGR02302 family protein [Mesorhizobium]|uniref:TIGR02302 family protein n=2 Tax=Mesorhizobium TaxID=68287 RepID=A0A1A5JMC0_RHILI|nr:MULTISPECIES: TIGR02302 family protein [Mesorhizobium]MBE1707013.1 TIGR02302 family protein [Mesorhizobium japonicum]MBE1716088.1 TIGR02302 family protein [Mesorhizobium japonicum]MUT20766.1 TIGR02302 family protein [Mesorhizobium japonicum]MUT28222.1 TIGR02302 family protein [Mesorhizobium japonicum]OBP80909.1 TIGR02302 family protein [Mesorhizobium loti]
MTQRPTSSDRGLARRLALSRLATRVSMMVERGWPLLLPLILIACLFLSISWFGIFSRLPDVARIGLVAAFGLAGLAALYPLRFFRLPGAAEVDRRIEAANELLHSPVLVQADRPSGRESSFSQALWREHQKRMAARLDRLGADMPRTRVPERDPWGLRAVAALLLVTAFAFSFGPTGGKIADGFSAHGAHDALPPRIDAWVTPPAYTGKPPIFLTADANQATPTFHVPEGSDVSLRVTGGSGEETLAYADKDGNARVVDPAGPQAASAKPAASPAASALASPSKVRQFTSKLTGDGTLTLKSGEDQLGRWAFAVIADKPPQIRFVGEPKRAANGAFELNYQIDDDYGAATAKAVFTLADPLAPGAHPLYGPPEMPLALPRRGGKSNAAKTTKDLTEHVWAGGSIKLTLVAADDAGHTASSETKTLVMPERPFANPLARAVIEQRRLLALDANAKPHVLDLIDAITLRPEDTFDNMSHYLAIMSARSRLKLAGNDDQLRGEVAYLWEIALGIEEGNLSAAEKRLRQAQQALQEAIKNGASDQEIEKAMKELREAMNQFLQEFAERAKQNPNAPQMQQNGQELRQSDIDRMMDQIENLAKSGDRDKAQQLLSQLQDMMNNLQAGRRQQGGEQDSQMRQQMDKLGEILRRQQEMMNDTFRMDQMQRGERQRGQNRDEQLGQGGGEDQDKPGVGEDRDPLARQKPMTPQEFSDALKQLQEGQGQLKSDLEQLKKNLEGMGMEPNEGFGEAGKSMGSAEQALGEGQGDEAVGHQGRALEALRKGAKDMMKQMQAMQGDQGGSQEGGRQQNADRDPLGRPRASQGPDFGDSVKVPDEIDVQRARQILEAIRKRLGNALSPDIERSYLERLLELK